jgi:SAM-dependent methyltransferase
MERATVTAYTSPRPDVLEMIPRNATAVLDVGCSNGELGFSVKQALPAATVAGIEIDPAFAEQARQRLDKVVCADLNSLDWASRLDGLSFDCIVFADVLEHLAQPARHLALAKSILKPGGCVVLSLPNIRHVSALYAIFARGTFPRNDRGLFDSTHLRWFTLADARAMLRDAGLNVERESYALRWRDKGGGALNRAMNRLPDGVKAWPWVREFLAYQTCMRSIPRA